LNVDVLILAGEAAFLVAVARGRWALGGILLGLAVSIKPAVLPLVLVPLLYRQWLAAGLILGVPVVLSAVALSLGVNGGEYVTWTVPYLLHGDTQTSDVQIYNISLPGAVANLGLPHVFATIAQFATVVVVGVLIWMRRRIDGVGDLTLTELSGLLVLATLLAFSFSFDRYALWLLPLFVSITHPSSSARAWVTLVAAYCIGAPDGLLWSRFTPLGDRWQVRLTFGLLFLLGVLAWSISRRFMAHRRTPNLGLAAKPATPVDRAPRVV
jgi:arabinofuranan 3-O-arabinosyltransferase